MKTKYKHKFIFYRGHILIIPVNNLMSVEHVDVRDRGTEIVCPTFYGDGLRRDRVTLHEKRYEKFVKASLKNNFFHTSRVVNFTRIFGNDNNNNNNVIIFTLFFGVTMNTNSTVDLPQIVPLAGVIAQSRLLASGPMGFPQEKIKSQCVLLNKRIPSQP